MRLQVCPSSVSSWVKAWDAVTGGSTERVGKFIVKLGAHAALPCVKHLCLEVTVGPIVPSHKRCAEEASRRILGLRNITTIGKTPTVSGRSIFVVDHQRMSIIPFETIVSGTIVLAVARRGHANNVVVLGEYNNVLPVVSVATRKATADGLILLKVVFVHNGTVAIVAALPRVCVGVLKLMEVSAVALWCASSAVAGVCLDRM